MRCDVALLKNVALHAKLPLEQLQLPANPLGVNSEGRKVRRQQGRQNSLTAMAQSFSESTERRLREFFKTDKAVTADRVGGFLFSIFFFSLSLSLSLSLFHFFSFLFFSLSISVLFTRSGRLSEVSGPCLPCQPAYRWVAVVTFATLQFFGDVVRARVVPLIAA